MSLLQFNFFFVDNQPSGHSINKDEKLKNLEKRKKLKERLEFYKSSFTVHGLNFLFTGGLAEGVFWFVCMLAVLGFTGYMTYRYVTRYLAYEIRTEMRFIENETIALPVMTFCLRSTFFSHLFCYNNVSYHPTFPCVKQKVISTKVLYKENKGQVMAAEDLGRNCYAVNTNGSISVAGKLGSVTVQFWSSNSNIDYLVIGFQTPNEFKNRRDSLYVTQYGTASLLTQGNWRIYLKQTQIKRQPEPYVSNCTNAHRVPNHFSTIYTKSSCQEMCLFERMYEYCGDVIDQWKQYLSKPAKLFRNTTYPNREACLLSLVRKTIGGELLDCNCQLSCNETSYDATRMDPIFRPPPTPQTWTINFFYKDEKVTQITEVPDYPLEDFLGAFGGILGLAIGALTLSLIELLVYFVMFMIYKL